MVLYIRRSGCLQKAQLDFGSAMVEQWDVDHSHTVDVDLVLLHELPEPGEAFSCVYCLHV